MSDALPLPPRPNLEQYKKLAKDFQHACKSSDPGAIREWAARWAEAIARLQGLEITSEAPRQIDDDAERIEQRWHRFKKTNEGASRCTLAGAQFFVARGHGFASWPKFAKHLEGLARANSPVSKFEAAADAIIRGDAASLRKLLSENPELARARSTREHHSTLLHYVSANGIEDFRQTTPKNIIEITKLLLEAGADVNAESDAYGGRSTTLGLTATSWHPENAGVQLPLMELLIDHGAVIDSADGGSAINSCLANGRGQAAEFLADRGARLDLEGAAGLGRLDLVKSYFNEDGSLKSDATQAQMKSGFQWACASGRTSVADFLLEQDIEAGERHRGETGLHQAACGGHVDVVKLLLKHRAPVDIRDETWGSTPLGWALWCWSHLPWERKSPRYYEVVTLLMAAGAKVEPEWLADGKVRADPAMLTVLSGKMPG